MIRHYCHGIRGATVARLTPDQMAACSNHVGFKSILALLLVSYSIFIINYSLIYFLPDKNILIYLLLQKYIFIKSFNKILGFWSIISKPLMSWKSVNKNLEMPGIEPGASYMQSMRSTTELHPRIHTHAKKNLNEIKSR